LQDEVPDEYNRLTVNPALDTRDLKLGALPVAVVVVVIRVVEAIAP